MSEEEKIKTICKDCVFAIYNKYTQTGCQFNRIENFAKNGAEIVEACDNDKEFYIIDGRFCNACRNKSWAKNVPKRKWKSVTEKEFGLQCDIILTCKIVDDNETIYQTIKSCYDQIHKPKIIVVVLECDFPQNRLLEILKFLKNNESNEIKWKLESISEAEYDPIDVGFKSVKSNYMTIFKAGDFIGPNFLKIINDYINVYMNRFTMIHGDFLVIQSAVFKEVFGNKGETAENKIIEFAESLDNGHMIKRWEDICQY